MQQAIRICTKELKDYFISPIAYIVISIFLLVTGWFFFTTFFYYNQADLRNFFDLLPITFSFRQIFSWCSVRGCRSAPDLCLSDMYRLYGPARLGACGRRLFRCYFTGCIVRCSGFVCLIVDTQSDHRIYSRYDHLLYPHVDR